MWFTKAILLRKMIKFSIKIKMDKDAEKNLSEKFKRVLMKSMFKMEELAVGYAPVDTNDLWQHITVFPEILANEYVLKSSMPYSEAMEYGSKPFYAPIEPLKDWARRKLGDEGAAYAVRASIAKKGIRAHPFMRPAFYEVVNFWVDQFKNEEFKY